MLENPTIVCSITVTSKVAVPTPPSESVAVQVTVVVPTENSEPDVTSHVGPLDRSLSVAVTSKGYNFRRYTSDASSWLRIKYRSTIS